MEKDEAIKLLKAGRSEDWNQYRKTHPEWKPNLLGADLSTVNFVPGGKSAFDLSYADLRGVRLSSNSSYFSTSEKTLVVQNAVVDADTRCSGFDLVKHGAVFISKNDSLSYNPSRSPQVFISYAWADQDVILAIDYWLRAKRIITRIDKRDFFAGTRIRDEIIRVMRGCDVILIFLSQQSKDKPWPEFERELAADLEITAKQEKATPPRIIFVILDDTPLPGISERNRIAVLAKGKRFNLLCEEIYHNILMIPKSTDEIDLDKWDNYVF